MSTDLKMFVPLPSSYLPEVRRQSLGRFFGSCIRGVRKGADLSIEEAARLSGMAASEWTAVEEGCVPQDVNQLRAMAGAMEISFDQISTLVLVCRAAWEL